MTKRLTEARSGVRQRKPDDTIQTLVFESKVFCKSANRSWEMVFVRDYPLCFGAQTVH